MTKRHAKKILIGLLVTLVLAAFGVGIQNDGKVTPQISKPHTPPGYYHVVTVHDGDTIDVEIAGKKETVRFIGMDTPEVKDPRKPVQCFGKAASTKTHELLDNKNVRLEADSTTSDRDKYKRLLRYIYLEDGTLVNQYLVQQGYAFAYTIFPNAKLEQFRDWEQEARQNNRGLWAGCSVNESSEIKQTNSE